MTVIPREVSDGFLVRDADDAYALGLWCADSYWWSSSIGISNVEPELVLRFARYLATLLPPDRLRVRVYEVEGQPPDERVLELTSRISRRPSFKMRRTAYHAYVNSRSLLRRFLDARKRISDIPLSLVGPYFAGRFDGDGSLGTERVPGARIVYTCRQEAEIDAQLLVESGVTDLSILRYCKANEFCVYIKRPSLATFEAMIASHSWKVGRLLTL